MTGGLDAILVIFGALAGAVVGSFAGVVRARGWRGAVRGRSRCEGCRRELRWYELVPVVSYAVQAGRCRRCRAPIGLTALWVELIGAAIGAALFLGAVGLASLLTR
jgi:leader peptidase (prepilin peptidase)/N-methyltransferase